MSKQRSKKLIVVAVLCIFALVVLGVWKHRSPSSSSATRGTVSTSPDSATSKPFIASDNTFSFQMPGDFNSSDLIQDDGSETTLFVGSNTDRNFQLHIADYAGGDLTADGIKASLPDLVMDSPETIAVDGAKGVAFISGPKDGTLHTREIWFAHASHIYQISTYQDFDEQMVNILTTWKWQ